MTDGYISYHRYQVKLFNIKIVLPFVYLKKSDFLIGNTYLKYFLNCKITLDFELFHDVVFTAKTTIILPFQKSDSQSRNLNFYKSTPPATPLLYCIVWYGTKMKDQKWKIYKCILIISLSNIAFNAPYSSFRFDAAIWVMFPQNMWLHGTRICFITILRRTSMRWETRSCIINGYAVGNVFSKHVTLTSEVQSPWSWKIAFMKKNLREIFDELFWHLRIK